MKLWHPLLALALAGGVFIYHLADQRRHEAQLGQVRADLASLSTSVAQAQRSAHEERAHAPHAPVVVVAAPSVEAPPPELAPSAAGPSRGAAEHRALEPAEVRAKIDTAFAREGVDPTWTTQAQATAQTRLAAALPETSKLRSVECHSSMCRFETVHEDADHVNQFVQRAFMNSATQVWNGGFFSTAVPEAGTDKVVIVSYLARDGEELDPVRLLQ
jgi:hypothetical protein